MRPRVLNVVLTHQGDRQVEAMSAWWERHLPADDLLLVRSGSAVSAAAHPQRQLATDDPRLRTRDHQRERQSYSGVFAAVARWLAANRDFTYVHFAEYDHLPLVPDLNERQLAALAAERADVLGFGVQRVDGTNHAPYLHHRADPAFAEFWHRLSRRADRETVLVMFGSGSFWTRAAFLAVAGINEATPIYLELFLPTAAHHLGYRVRRYPDPEAGSFIRHQGDLVGEIEAARARGAWSIHPVKTLWG